MTDTTPAPEPAEDKFCPRHGVLHNRTGRACAPDCTATSNRTWSPLASAAIATAAVARVPAVDGVGLIGALDEWVRWSA